MHINSLFEHFSCPCDWMFLSPRLKTRAYCRPPLQLRPHSRSISKYESIFLKVLSLTVNGFNKKATVRVLFKVRVIQECTQLQCGWKYLEWSVAQILTLEGWVVALTTFNWRQRLEEMLKRWGAIFLLLLLFEKQEEAISHLFSCIFTHKIVQSSSELLSAATAGYLLRAFHWGPGIQGFRSW